MIMDRIALILVIVGAVNWGSVGLFQFDLVSWVFGGQDALVSRIIYTVIALAGAPKRELQDRPNSRELDKLMEERKFYRYAPGDPQVRPTDATEKYHLGVAAPIVSQGDLMGCVMMLLEENSQPLPESDQRLAQTIAEFLGRQMES